MFKTFTSANRNTTASANCAEASFPCAKTASHAACAHTAMMLDAALLASIIVIMGVLGLLVLNLLVVRVITVVIILAVLGIMKQLHTPKRRMNP